MIEVGSDSGNTVQPSVYCLLEVTRSHQHDLVDGALNLLDSVLHLVPGTEGVTRSHDHGQRG